MVISAQIGKSGIGLTGSFSGTCGFRCGTSVIQQPFMATGGALIFDGASSIQLPSTTFGSLADMCGFSHSQYLLNPGIAQIS
jgi:hypothetical protein